MAYAELDRRRIAFAHALRKHGVHPGAAVLLVSDNSIEYVVALFGTLTAAATVVPLPGDTPVEKLRTIAGIVSARVILVGRAARLDEIQREAPCPVFALAAGFPIEPRTSLALPTVGASELALLLFTSGTTGVPKGVMLTHANLVANAMAIVKCLSLTHDDSVVNILPFFYSYGNSVLLTHLLVGGTVVIENRFSFPEIVVESLLERQPTGFYGVPTTFYMLLSRTSFPQRDWTFLRYVAQAGGGMRVDTIRRLRDLLPKTDVYIMYGQTEAAARLTVLPPAQLDSKLGAIGWPLPDVAIRVVDEAGEELPAGETGELVAQGPNIMAGYYGDPASTREALRDGWLHTGDIARRDEDGCLYVVGRKSDFIKSAAVRVAPAEIEEVIAACDGVEDVAAFGLEDPLLGEAVAVCVTTSSGDVDPAEILRICSRRLPPHMVPKYIFFDNEIPKTASGKKQYFRLREKYRRSVDVDGLPHPG